MNAREAAIREAAARGMTLMEACKFLNKSPSNVCEGARKYGVRLARHSDKIAARRAVKFAEGLEKRARRFFGCSHAEFLAIKDIPNVIAGYQQHKSCAKKREVAFELSLPEWWQVWNDSGKFAERGRGATKFVMCRCGDFGPYKAGNVFIATGRENVKEYFRDNRANRLAYIRAGMVE